MHLNVKFINRKEKMHLPGVEPISMHIHLETKIKNDFKLEGKARILFLFHHFIFFFNKLADRIHDLTEPIAKQKITKSTKYLSCTNFVFDSSITIF